MALQIEARRASAELAFREDAAPCWHTHRTTAQTVECQLAAFTHKSSVHTQRVTNNEAHRRTVSIIAGRSAAAALASKSIVSGALAASEWTSAGMRARALKSQLFVNPATDRSHNILKERSQREREFGRPCGARGVSSR